MNNSLALVAANVLPALSGSSLSYDCEKNAFVTPKYTSASGNSYYRAIRFSDRVIVMYLIGIGYIHNFLDGITLFAWNGQQTDIIAQKSWGGSGYCIFSEQFAKEESISMLKNFLAGQAKFMGNVVADNKLLDFSKKMIEETQQKLI